VSSEPAWVTVALLGKARGNRGEVTAIALSSKLERFEKLGDVYLFGGRESVAGGQDPKSLAVESVWSHQGTLIFKFRGVDTISAAELLSGAEVRVPWSERTALEPGEFYESDLVGCQVVDRRTGETLGRVSGWQDAGGSGLLVVDNDWLIPFARSMCVEIDPSARQIKVELPEGLKDLNRS